MKSIILLIIAVVILISIYFFNAKYNIEYEMIYEIPDKSEDFRPLAYAFFHSEKEFKNYTTINDNTKKIGAKMSDIPFDFNKYSYCIFFGKKITSMYHSSKASFFDDPTPSYARTKGKIPVFVEYENESNNTGIFIYRVPRDIRLRGFYD